MWGTQYILYESHRKELTVCAIETTLHYSISTSLLANKGRSLGLFVRVACKWPMTVSTSPI